MKMKSLYITVITHLNNLQLCSVLPLKQMKSQKENHNNPSEVRIGLTRKKKKSSDSWRNSYNRFTEVPAHYSQWIQIPQPKGYGAEVHSSQAGGAHRWVCMLGIVVLGHWYGWWEARVGVDTASILKWPLPLASEGTCSLGARHIPCSASSPSPCSPAPHFCTRAAP